MLPAAHNDEHEITDEGLSRYLVIERTELCRADLGLVFGDRHCYEKLARQAADLYHKSYFPRLIVSGGREDDLGCIEADAIQYHLQQFNVPARAILTERASTDTIENVAFSRHLAIETYGRYGIQSVIAIGNATMGRRFPMALAQHWPQVFAMAANVNPFPFPLEDWPRNAAAASGIRKEFCKTTNDLNTGDVAEIDIQHINRQAVSRRAKLFQRTLTGL